MIPNANNSINLNYCASAMLINTKNLIEEEPEIVSKDDSDIIEYLWGNK
jgi:hypothetical protein